MSCKEQQEEEIEVLKSIYDGDDAFKQVSENVFQYKVGEDGEHKSFVLEVCWGDEYPQKLPGINLDAFYNKHIIDDVKKSVVQKLIEQAEDLLDTAMTYTLFEFAKEQAAELMEDQPDAPVQAASEESPTLPNQSESTAKPKQKKEQLSKAQKRKMYNRLDTKGELPRGHDWVDIVRHLSQTGNSQS